MNVDCFLKRFTSILLSDEHDAIFEAIKLWVGGTTSARLAKVLNFAVSQLEGSECYVETGVYLGGTLISAFQGNGKPCIGIDPYGTNVNEAILSNPEVIRDRARMNIQNLSPGAVLLEKDFRDVRKEDLPSKIGVSLIDARHRYEDVWDNMVWLSDKLSNNAVVFFDDVNYHGVSQAIFEWVSKHSENWQMICHISPFYSSDLYLSPVMDRTLNNGLSILRYHADPKSEALFLGPEHLS